MIKMKSSKLILLFSAALALQSCAKEDTLRTDGLTLGAGDAMARNMALQVIDPWPNGVEDTDIVTPNSRPKIIPEGEGTAAPGGATSTSPTP
jgi:hypothetical protein